MTKNMFVSYSYPRFDCKLNASRFDLHGPSFVSSIPYKSAFMDLYLSDKSQYLNHSAILLKALGGGIRVLWTHISSYYFIQVKSPRTLADILNYKRF